MQFLKLHVSWVWFHFSSCLRACDLFTILMLNPSCLKVFFWACNQTFWIWMGCWGIASWCLQIVVLGILWEGIISILAQTYLSMQFLIVYINRPVKFIIKNEWVRFYFSVPVNGHRQRQQCAMILFLKWFYMEVCNLVRKLERKCSSSWILRKVTCKNQTCNLLITGQMLYPLGYRDLQG